MFHMLCSFDLGEDVGTGEFRATLGQLASRLRRAALLHSVSPLGRRQRHPIMDTDEERDHEYYFFMSFEDRGQCDRAAAQMYRDEGETGVAHRALQAMIRRPIFTCFEDVSD